MSEVLDMASPKVGAGVDDLKLWFELVRLQEAYVATIDDDRLEAWPDFFTPNGYYEVIPRENREHGFAAGVIHCRGQGMMRDRILSLRHANVYERHFYRHLTSGLMFEHQDDGSVAMRSNYVVVQTRDDGLSYLFQAGIYEDVVVRTEGGWKYKSKRAVYDTSRIHTLLVIPV